MNIYDKKTTIFNNNGIGFLTDVITSLVTDVLNGEYSVSFEYLIGGKNSEYLIEENIVKCKVADGTFQLFRIKTIIKNIKTIKVYAVHIFYDLRDNQLIDVYPTEKNCHDALEWVINNAQYQTPFTVESDIITIASARYVRKNVVESIMGDIDNSILKTYNGEIERDNYNIKVTSKRGYDNKVKLIFGKNIKEITINIDSSNVVTRVMPVAYDGLLLPEKYIDSPIILDYKYPKINTYDCSDIKVDPTDPEALATEEQAFSEMRRRSLLLYNDNHIDKPNINIKIDWLELSKTKEYYDKYQLLEKVKVGDVINCQIYDMNYKTRCIKTIYNNLNDTTESFEIGTLANSFIYTADNQIKTISDKINDIDPISILKKAKNEATDLITSAMGGYVYKTQNELYIMDTDNPSTAQIVWRWNINGLGYSTNGINGEYGIAITSDGKIVADYVTAGELDGIIMKANSIKASSIETEALISGGDNQIINSVGYFGSDGWVNAHDVYSDTDIISNTDSHSAWLLKNQTSKQILQKQNQTYTLSYKYKKLIELANCLIKINGIELVLNSLEWESNSYTFDVNSSTIEIEIIGDTLNCCYLSDLIIKPGIVKSIWSSAAGESVNGGVKIGRGIEITSSTSNTMQKMDNDGNRIYNTNTNEIVSEFTDKGLDTKEIISDKGQIGKLLMVDMGSQTWLSRM